MNKRNLELFFFFAVFIIVLIVSFYIFLPYLYALVLAITFAIIFNPIYNRLSALLKHQNSLSALLTLLIVLITVLIPLTLLGGQIFREAETVYSYLSTSDSTSNFYLLEDNINSWLSANLGINSNPVNVPLDLNLYLKSALAWLFQNVGSLLSSITSITLNILIFLFAFYYLLKDGKKMRKELIELSPLADRYDEEIAAKLERAVNSIIKGTIVLAILQGIAIGFGFYFFGIPNAALWGAAAALASFIPAIGAALVVIAAVLFLIFTGHVAAGVGLMIWGILAIGFIGNFIGPKIVQRGGVQVHSFFILLFAIGGLSFFGPIGFLLGPLVLSLLFSLIDVYKLIGREEVTR